MAWVENMLNLSYSYYGVTSSEGDQFEYLDQFEYVVPTPPWYNSTIKAYWTTDVIVLEPSCSWQTPTAVEVNSTWDVSLHESNLSVTLTNDSIGMFLLPSNFFMCLLYFSIKPYDAVFSFRVRQQKFGIHCSCGRFNTFCHRSTCHRSTPIEPSVSANLSRPSACDNHYGPLLHPNTQLTHRKRPCVPHVLSQCLF